MNPSNPAIGKDTYELLIHGLTDYAIYMLAPDGRVISWNPGAERIKGYTADEIIGEHFSRFYTEEDRAAGAPARTLITAAEAGRFHTEAWRVRRDGSRFWANVVVDPIRQAGELIGFAKITRDMTEQRQAQLAALESERRFRLLVQSVTDYAIFMLNCEGYVSNWNAGAERIKGYAEPEIVGCHFSRFYTSEDLAQGVPMVALETARREGRFEAEGWRVRKDGERFWASVVIDAVYDNGRLVGFAKITRDLTERRQAQLELEQSREQLFQAQKMEAVGQLTGGLAHDFNNLLAGINGSLELLSARITQGRYKDLDRLATMAQSAATRAATLTHRLLAFSRRQTLDPRPTNVNQLVAGMEELIRRTIGPAVELRVTAAAGLWPTLVDQNQLENALLNLCINARDAMPDGGCLTVKTANQWLDSHAARTVDLPPGQYVTLAISDTGTGMTPEVMAKAFDPFFTTKPEGKGTGLGLSMVYGFVRQSNGQVRISSQPGHGTSICLYLPFHPIEAQASETLSDTVAPSSGGLGKTIFVVDDEPTVRMMVSEALQELGYATLEANDSQGGLKILQSDVQIDLLVSDIGLPGGMNGRQMVDIARSARPGLKVLFITGYAEHADVSSIHMQPGMQVLTKPFSLDALTTQIGSLISSKESS
ncbi:PAS domain S-box protein [Pseudoroseomonas wenyumeiae]|uniref:histidine kinase n=1 Tax=Teichococcus wenyumeiae TaxID=2478470 RepID=A0A3A9JRC1_9PROT|nr:PAS domain-containing sensor histidine kinase [Pseudoroseomonas wenyumeiae]RKK03218.1 PAS domain-containing sensor histidine kinase [Pseudoroseomonas wenyumeiae]RMI15560.1 PAS domain S-box protein [Pseudoroseomonas wenyumeiae]